MSVAFAALARKQTAIIVLIILERLYYCNVGSSRRAH
jgi:hypothetical protein